MTVSALSASFRVVVGARLGGFELQADLQLDDGVLVLYGPSGAGKSLTLCALAGLCPLIEGTVSIAGQAVEDCSRGQRVAAECRGLGYVPQHTALFPFCDVEQNIAFGLPRAERRRGNPAIAELMQELGVFELRGARPDSLSGGERQRVALARALAIKPKLLLLDEPFAFIDPTGRKELRNLLLNSLRRRGISALLVTHSRDEALAMGNRVVLYERGRTLAQGSPALVLAGQD